MILAGQAYKISLAFNKHKNPEGATCCSIKVAKLHR